MQRRSSLFSNPKPLPKRISRGGFWSKLWDRIKPKRNKFVSKNSSSTSSYYRPSSIHKRSSFDTKTTDNIKVFKPAADALLKDKVKNTINPGSVKKFTFGQKNLDFIQRNTNLLNLGNLLKNINFYVVKWEIVSKFNRFLAILLATVTVISIIYISLFDKFFLIKTYSIGFNDNSYLDDDQVTKITQSIRQDKIMGLLPNNQYWFLSDYNLTQIAKKTYPEVQSVEIKNRIWPNQAELKITTEPILITMGINENNQKRYWRISQSGKVLNEDNLGMRENLVEVDKIISFDKPGYSLKDYPLDENKTQLNRYWFTLWLWSTLGDLDIRVTKTSFPTLLDTDVEILTDRGTRLLFDSATMTRDNQYQRIKATLNTSINNTPVRTKFDNKQIKYIDFRIPKRVFVCDNNKDCSSSV